jgi:uncharacterized protein (DUF305 family)
MRLLLVILSSTLVLPAALSSTAQAQSSDPPVPIVMPGAPGQANTVLDPAHAKPPLNKPSDADVAFMQGMIMHHGQAVEMTELLTNQGTDPALKELGARIANSQSSEIIFMKRWLTDRGFPTTMPMDDMGGMDMGDMSSNAQDMPPMPGMLTKKQMAALAASHGPAFDHLFLTGMIQHHTGALTMVTDLFAHPGAAQDPILFDFASDVNSTQTAEILTMKNLLKKEKQ